MNVMFISKCQFGWCKGGSLLSENEGEIWRIGGNPRILCGWARGGGDVNLFGHLNKGLRWHDFNFTIEIQL